MFKLPKLAKVLPVHVRIKLCFQPVANTLAIQSEIRRILCTRGSFQYKSAKAKLPLLFFFRLQIGFRQVGLWCPLLSCHNQMYMFRGETVIRGTIQVSIKNLSKASFLLETVLRGTLLCASKLLYSHPLVFFIGLSITNTDGSEVGVHQGFSVA